MICQKLVNALDDAAIRDLPSRNIYFQNWCDDPEYRILLKRLPMPKSYIPIVHPDAMRDGSTTRYLLDLTARTLADMDSERRDYWRPWLAKEFHEQLTKKLFHILGISEKDAVCVPIFYTDLEGYRILPHTDAAFKIATCQLYFPEDETSKSCGTEFYQRSEDGSFSVICKNPFVPKSGYAFRRTEVSWHGVDTVIKLDYPRKSLAFTWYRPGFEYSSEAGYVAPEERAK